MDQKLGVANNTITSTFTVSVLIVSFFVMGGWLFGIDGLKTLLPGLPSMKFNTALAFCFSSLSLLVLKRRPKIAASFALATIILGGLSLIEYIFTWDLGIDQLIILDIDATEYPGRMSHVTAFAFILIGLVLFTVSISPKWHQVLEYFVFTVIGLSAIVLIGYIYGAEQLYGVLWFSSVALHTAICFMILGIAILFEFPHHSIIRIFGFKTVGGYLIRRLLPLIIIIPIVAGWLRWQGELAGFYNTEFGLILFTLTTIIILSFISWRIAFSLHETDLERMAALESLHQSRLELETKVYERTQELTATNQKLEVENTQRRQAEAQFRAILEAAPDGVIIVDKTGKIVILNTQAEKLFAYTRDELLGKSVDSLLPQTMREKHSSHRSHYLLNPHTRNMGTELELLGQRKDGSQFPIEVSLSPVYGDGLELVFSLVRDVSERHEYERMLRFYASVQENVSDAVITTDLEYRIQSWNPAAERIYGWKAEEVIGKTAMEVLHTRFESEEERQRIIASFLEHGFWQSEYTQTHKNGSTIPILGSTTLMKNKNGESFGIVSVNRDITERKQAEIQARRLQASLNNMVEGAQIIDFDWRYVYINDVAASQGQKSKEELIGQRMMDVYPGIEKTPLFEVLERCMNDRKPEHIENNFQFADGKMAWLDFSIQPVTEGIFILSMDISDRKRLEIEIQKTNLRLREANEEVQRFAYIVSHDLRAPLINLKGFSEILRNSIEQLNTIIAPFANNLETNDLQRWQILTQDKVPTSLRFIGSSVDRMDYLTSAILKLSRLGHNQLNFEKLDPNLLVQKILDSMSSQIIAANIEVRIEQLPEIEADLVSIDQVFGNLIGNAIKYLDPKRQGIISITGTKDQFQCTFHIQDNGRGINHSHYDRIFAPFRRGITDVDGEGMGLAYVQALIKRHSGNLWFESTVDQGTTFSFSIPHSKQ